MMDLDKLIEEEKAAKAAYLADLAAKEAPESARQRVLEAALQIVLSDRQTAYGPPESNFGIIADLWTVYLDVPVRPDDVAAMMILLKLARHKNSRQMDNAVDIAGYAACMFEVDSR
jgi:hypothetical protein